MDAKLKLKYVDTRPIVFPRLKHYPAGIEFTGLDDKEFFVTDGERKTLLKCYKNGDNPCFVEVREPRLKLEE